MDLASVLAELWWLVTSVVQIPRGSTMVLALPSPNSNGHWWIPLVGSAVTAVAAGVAAWLAVRSFTLGRYFDRQEAVRSKTRDAVAVVLAKAWEARRASERSQVVLPRRRAMASLDAHEDVRRIALAEEINEATGRVTDAYGELLEAYELLNLYLAVDTRQMRSISALIVAVAELRMLLPSYDPSGDFQSQVEERSTAREKVVAALDEVIVDARNYAQTPGRKPSRWYRWTDPYDDGS